MSWFLQLVVENGDIDPKGTAAWMDVQDQSQEHHEQVDALGEFATLLIKSGALGDPDGKYYVNLSGHGNPGHLPAEGWANDHVSLSISQA